MKEDGNSIKDMAKGSIFIQILVFTTVIGSKMKGTEWVK